jgi:hypothetical protein
MSTAHDAHHDDHGHGHHGSRFVQHHYDDAQHQFDAGKLGIWLFLAQEVLFFSALFVAYVLYRVHHGELYSYAHKWLDVKYGAINTAVLIFSSLTAAWAVRCAQLGQRKGLILCIATTIACAVAFLGIKYIEYSHKYHEQILFGRYFDPCVSPGGNEMITKSNECPGIKGTPVWDFGAAKATEGCYETSTLDQDAFTDGVQADCQVFELKGHRERDKDGKLGFKETGRRPVTERCHESRITTRARPSPKATATRKRTSSRAGRRPTSRPCVPISPMPRRARKARPLARRSASSSSTATTKYATT